jgi:hypothetical protein
MEDVNLNCNTIFPKIKKIAEMYYDKFDFKNVIVNRISDKDIR